MVDLIIAYEDYQNAPSFLDLIKLYPVSKAIFNYKIYNVKQTSGIGTEEWLNRLWKEKEVFLRKYYTEREALLDSLTQFNVRTINWIKVFILYVFFLSFYPLFYVFIKYLVFL